MEDDSFDMSQVQAALLDEALDMSFEDLPDLVSDASDDDDFVVVPPRRDVRTPRNAEALNGSWEARLVGWEESTALNYLTCKTRVQGSPHEVEFRAKFGVSRLVFDRILQELRVCHVNWAREGNKHKLFLWLKRQERLPETVNDVYWKGGAATVAEQEHLTKYCEDNGCPWWPRVAFMPAHLQPNGRGQYQLVPAALKLLGALAYLKTGASVRAISTDYGMGYNTLNTFVSNFVVWAAYRLNVVSPPGFATLDTGLKSSFLVVFFICSVIKRFFLRVFCASHASVSWCANMYARLRRLLLRKFSKRCRARSRSEKKEAKGGSFHVGLGRKRLRVRRYARKIGIFPARLQKALHRLDNLRKDKGLQYMAPGDKLVSSAAKELSNQMRDGVNVKKRKKVRKRKDETVRNLAEAFENGISSSDDETETDDELAPQPKKKKSRHRTVDHGRFITSQEYDNNLQVLADVAQENKRKRREEVIARREAKKAETRARKEAEKESRNAAKKAKKSAGAPLPPPPPS